jgi:general secretion pathway protein G
MKMRSLSQRAARRAAFTLMEMMVVVAIIVALAGVGIFYMAGQADEGNKARVKANIKSLTDACVIYKAQHNGQFPQSLADLTQKDQDGFGPYIEREGIFDPWGREYTYDPSGQQNQTMKPDITCTMPGGLGTVVNWSSKIQR